MDSITEFLAFLHNKVNKSSEQEFEELYSSNLILEFQGHKVAIPFIFMAVEYEALTTALMKIEEKCN